MMLIDAEKLEEKIEYDFKRKKITRYDRELLLHYLDIEMLIVADALKDAGELLKEQEWIPISERLPENAEHPGAFCPKVRVLTVWGESYGWYNPDVKAWYFLEWYTDCSRNHLDFERGDYPGICYTPRNTNLITHWKPIP